MMEKALITEAEVRDAISDGSFTILVNGEPIITPLAASSIEEHGIKVVQSGVSSSGSSGGGCVTCVGCPDEPLDISGRDTQFLVDLLSMMFRVRGFEVAMGVLFREKRLVGFLHLSIGQEAIAVGACSALNQDDYLTLTHRGHGQMVAKGSDLKRMAAELLGKKTGYCQGKGGSVHLADFSQGVLGANGIIGAGIVIATGAAMSAKIRKSSQVALSFFGDGAVNQGAFHEGLNYASAQKLPVIFVCENNQYAVSTETSFSCSTSTITERGKAYGMPAIQVDGQNVLLVHDTVQQAAQRARSGGGPTLIECITYRYRGHWEGETTDLRPESEKALWKERDPIERLKNELISQNVLTVAKVDEIYNGVVQEIADAVRFAEESPWPAQEQVLQNVLSGGC